MMLLLLIEQQWLFIGVAVCLLPLLSNLARCYRAILNDARIISLDPALQGNFEILYAYPGFWALFWYRLSHALLERRIPILSAFLPRLAMSLVRYATAIDIHPGADISGDGILIDHGTGLVVGATAIIGGGVTLYHGVTLGNSGRKVAPGAKRHPTIGNNVVVGAGAKILGDIVVGDNVLIGANSVITKPVPKNHTAVGAPARIICHSSAAGKDVTGAAICELHKRLQKVERIESQQQLQTAEEAVRVEKNAPDEGQKQEAGEGWEPSLEKHQLAEESPDIMSLPSPLREKPKQYRGWKGEASASPVIASDRGAIATSRKTSSIISVRFPERFVLEKASPVSFGDDFTSEFIAEGEAEGTVSGIGEIMYSLRVLGSEQ